MNDIFLIAADYLKGKSVYQPARRLLNLLFNTSISSFIYERIYGSYTWLNYNDYKGILNFFIKGNFFIPFSIFFIVSLLLYFIATLLFNGLNYYQSGKWSRKIVQYEIDKTSAYQNLDNVSGQIKRHRGITIDKRMMKGIYEKIKNSLPPDSWDKFVDGLKKPKDEMEALFHTVSRALFAVTIYFISLPQFGWLLYVFVILSILISMYLILLTYCFLDVLPVLASKFFSVVQEYISAPSESVIAGPILTKE